MFASEKYALDTAMATYLWNKAAEQLGTDRQSVLRRFVESQYWVEDDAINANQPSRSEKNE